MHNYYVHKWKLKSISPAHNVIKRAKCREMREKRGSNANCCSFIRTSTHSFILKSYIYTLGWLQIRLQMRYINFHMKWRWWPLGGTSLSFSAQKTRKFHLINWYNEAKCTQVQQRRFNDMENLWKNICN